MCTERSREAPEYAGSPAIIDFPYRKAQHEALSLKKEVCCAVVERLTGRALFYPLPGEQITPLSLTSTKESAMTRSPMLLTMALLASPTLALAAEHSAGYRGIGYIYFTFIAAVLIYGVYDAFGKTAMYVMTPIILVSLFLMLPPV
jgi:hypothetical protein